MIGSDPEEIRLWWDIGQTLLLVGVGIHQWLIGRDRVRREALDAIRSDLARRIEHVEQAAAERDDNHGTRLTKLEASGSGPRYCLSEKRISVLEEQARHAPTRKDLNAVDAKAHHRMDLLAETLSELRGSTRRIEGTLDSIFQHLLNQGAPPRKD